MEDSYYLYKRQVVQCRYAQNQPRKVTTFNPLGRGVISSGGLLPGHNFHFPFIFILDLLERFRATDGIGHHKSKPFRASFAPDHLLYTP